MYVLNGVGCCGPSSSPGVGFYVSTGGGQPGFNTSQPPGGWTDPNSGGSNAFTLPGGIEVNWAGFSGDWVDKLLRGAEIAQGVYEGRADGQAGGACWTGYDNRPFAEPCPNTPDYDSVLRMVLKAPDAEINKLINYLRSGNSNRGPGTREHLATPECIPFWVKAILGGKGCVASTYPEAPAFFLSLVRQYGGATTSGNLPGLPGGLPGIAGGALGTGGALLMAGLALFFVPKLLGK